MDFSFSPSKAYIRLEVQSSSSFLEHAHFTASRADMANSRNVAVVQVDVDALSGIDCSLN